jgi:hypothetical protein
MNADTSIEGPAAAADDGRRRRPWATARLSALVAALATAALLTAACGGRSPSTAGSSGAGPGRLAAALAFAHCMRSHGAPGYPDPNSSGVFMVTPSTSSKFDAPQPTRAACAHLLPGKGRPPSPAVQAAQQRRELAFVACMHSHGFPQLPDGWSGNVGQLISTGIDPHSQRLSAAFTKCGSWS